MRDPDIGFLSEDVSNADGPNLYWYAQNNPINRIDLDGRDSYKTATVSPLHVYLVIDDPKGSGGVYYFSFIPNDLSSDISKVFTLRDVKAFAEVGFIPAGESRENLGTKIPSSRVRQDSVADQKTLDRARAFAKKVKGGEYKYNLFGFGEKSFNCLGATSDIQ